MVSLLNGVSLEVDFVYVFVYMLVQVLWLTTVTGLSAACAVCVLMGS